jgi:hypothetical protein
VKTKAIVTRTHILRGSRRGGYVAGLARHNKTPAHAASPTCAISMSSERVCEKCGATMSMRDLITHSRACANGNHWFETLPTLPISEERKLKRLLGYAK